MTLTQRMSSRPCGLIVSLILHAAPQRGKGSAQLPLKNWTSGERPLVGAKRTLTFHNNGRANDSCSSKAKMSALSKVEMSVFYLLVVRFGGCGSDGCGADEQTRAEPD